MTPATDERGLHDEQGAATDDAARPARASARVLFFGAARDAAGTDEVALDFDAPATAGTLFERLLDTYPALRRFGPSLLFAVNQDYARDPETEVRDGDELAVFPPVSGGGEAEPAAGALDFFELTTEPIDVGRVARRVGPAR